MLVSTQQGSCEFTMPYGIPHSENSQHEDKGSLPRLLWTVNQGRTELGIAPCQAPCRLRDLTIRVMDVRKVSTPSLLLLGIGERLGASRFRRDFELGAKLTARAQKQAKIHTRFLGKSVQAGQHRLQPTGLQLSGQLEEARAHRLVRDEHILRGFAPRLHIAREKTQVNIELAQLSTAVRESNRALSVLLVFRLLLPSPILAPLSITRRSGQCIGLLSEPVDGDRCQYGDHNVNATNCERCKCYRDSPRVPPNNAVTDSRFHAWADSMPQLLQAAHSLIPPWTAGHSATQMRPEEITHG
ncbi:hypothetical protein BurJV3_1774 [Stenotrophomonas maltophilia JV3]|nr:hypothetical protein BurJV3_1774 [Stenotrophomonas maltophilia JV3]